MRESGIIRLLVYRGDYKCAQSVVVGDAGSMLVRLSDLEPPICVRSSRRRCKAAQLRMGTSA
jgi:hypothetical protein